MINNICKIFECFSASSWIISSNEILEQADSVIPIEMNCGSFHCAIILTEHFVDFLPYFFPGRISGDVCCIVVFLQNSDMSGFVRKPNEELIIRIYVLMHSLYEVVL